MRVLLAIAAVGCAPATRNSSLLLSATALTICDYNQTAVASNFGRWDRVSPENPDMVLRERNPLLGETPSMGTLTAVVVGGIVANTVIAYSSLPEWLKGAWLGGVVLAESYMVTTNNFDGVCGIGDWSPGRLRL